MEISPHQSLDLSLQYMSAIAQRQSLTSANIANAHTPGYTAKSVSFSDLLQSDNPFETQLSHKMGSQLSSMNTDTGISVDLQKELIDMQKNMLYYSMVSRRASSVVSNIKAASQVGR
jgi:flagellar basal body rod protein FlgB